MTPDLCDPCSHTQGTWPLPENIDSFEFYHDCVDRSCTYNAEWDMAAYVTERNWALCDKAFEELDMDADGTQLVLMSSPLEK